MERLAGQLAEGSVNFAGIREMFLSDAWHRLSSLYTEHDVRFTQPVVTGLQCGGKVPGKIKLPC